MKIKVSKHKTKEELIEIFKSVLDTFDDLGVKQFKGSFYINTYDENSSVLTFADQEYSPLEALNGNNNPWDVPLMVEELNKKYPPILESKRKKLLEDLQEERRIRKLAWIEEQERERIKSVAARQALIDEENRFIEHVCKLKGIDYNNKLERQMLFSSTARTEDKRAILKQLDNNEALIPEEGYIFRASLKGEDGRVATVEIYNPRFELIRSYPYKR